MCQMLFSVLFIAKETIGDWTNLDQSFDFSQKLNSQIISLPLYVWDSDNGEKQQSNFDSLSFLAPWILDNWMFSGFGGHFQKHEI